jgi:4-diphosphocytidyl-2-C-methyl-D-erythritol kinase
LPRGTAGAIALDAPAKVNLALHVTGQREDGYHAINSLVVFTAFGDRLTISLAEEDRLEISGQFASSVQTDENNLVLRALNLLRRRFGDSARQPVLLSLEKNLPVSSGIGGGSSDAAATLRGLAHIWNLDADEHELAAIGLELGADVPMCLAARPLIARGVGEEIEPVLGFPSLPLVLVNPGVAIATSDVFGRLQNRNCPPLPALPPRLDLIGICDWLSDTRNDLETASHALQPVIGSALAALQAAGSSFDRMSGSGATCFGLFETREAASVGAQVIREKHAHWFVAATHSLPSEN